MEEAESQSFGALLRRLRSLVGLTQEELAERAGVSIRGVSDLERGLIAYPRRDTAELLASGLALSGESRQAFLDAARRPIRISRAATAVVEHAPPPGASLPRPPHALIGRESEIAFARELLTPGLNRLLTVTGPGGVGKTRFAIEVARELAVAFEHRVWFVELAPVPDVDGVLPAIAAAFDIDPGKEGVVIAAIGDEPALLLLDNFEHVQSAARLVGTLLDADPRLCVIVTSRSPLNLIAERELPLDPLPVSPDAEQGAVALFIERACQHDPSFAPAGDGLDAVVEICRRLDGLPLAIELAAARIRQLHPNALLARLNQRLDVLTGGSIDRPRRHQTLRDTIDWSYRLLDEEGQRLFRHLAVFVGGADLDQIAEVAGIGDATETLDKLIALEQHSLIKRAEQPASARFAMLETIREYGLEQLREHGELAAACESHASAFAALVDEHGQSESGTDRRQWIARLDLERDNLRAAYEHTARTGEWTRALGIASRLWPYWEARGRLREGSQALERALASASGAPAALRARGWNNLGNLANDAGNSEMAAIYYGKSLALRRELNDPVALSATLNNLGLLETNRADFEQARRLLDESLALRLESGDPGRIAGGFASLGNLALHQARITDARDLFERARVLHESTGNAAGVAYAWWYLGEVERLAGDVPRARQLLRQSLRLFRELDLAIGIANASTSLGELELASGDVPTAREHLRASLPLWREIGESRTADTMISVAEIAASSGDGGRAAQLLSAALAVRERTLQRISTPARAHEDRLRAEVEALCDPTDFAVFWVLGRSNPLARMLDLAEQVLDEPV